MKAGDKVTITPIGTIIPNSWKRPLTGTVLLVDGTVAVEVDDGGRVGHNFDCEGHLTDTGNGWWFAPEELEITEREKEKDVRI